jgi:hypothetical protein
MCVVVVEVVLLKRVVVVAGKNGQFSENHFVASLGALLAMAARISQKCFFFPFLTKTWQPWLPWQLFGFREPQHLLF